MEHASARLAPISRWASAAWNSLCWFTRRFGRAFPSLRKLAALLKCGVRTVQRALAELRAAGLLVSTRRYRRSSVHDLRDNRQMSFEFVGSMGRVRSGHGGETERSEVSVPCIPEVIPTVAIAVRNRPGTVGSTPTDSTTNQRLGASLGATVVNPRETILRVLPKVQVRETLQHRPDDVAEIARKAAGFERLSEGDRRWVQELERAGTPREYIEAGVLVGRSRKMVSASNSGESARVFSLRYFAGAIAEAPRWPVGYADHVRGWLRRRDAFCARGATA